MSRISIIPHQNKLSSGIRLYGITDSVPGHFYVATTFVHLLRIPLVPLQSYLIFVGNSNTVSVGTARGGAEIVAGSEGSPYYYNNHDHGGTNGGDAGGLLPPKGLTIPTISRKSVLLAYARALPTAFMGLCGVHIIMGMIDFIECLIVTAKHQSHHHHSADDDDDDNVDLNLNGNSAPSLSAICMEDEMWDWNVWFIMAFGFCFLLWMILHIQLLEYATYRRATKLASYLNHSGHDDNDRTSLTTTTRTSDTSTTAMKSNLQKRIDRHFGVASTMQLGYSIQELELALMEAATVGFSSMLAENNNSTSSNNGTSSSSSEMEGTRQQHWHQLSNNQVTTTTGKSIFVKSPKSTREPQPTIAPATTFPTCVFPSVRFFQNLVWPFRVAFFEWWRKPNCQFRPYGTDGRLFGLTDCVPGLFQVETKFFHLMRIFPIVPLQSYLILVIHSPTHDTFVPGIQIPIPLHYKSIVLAWTRPIAILTCASLLVFIMRTDINIYKNDCGDDNDEHLRDHIYNPGEEDPSPRATAADYESSGVTRSLSSSSSPPPSASSSCYDPDHHQTEMMINWLVKYAFLLLGALVVTMIFLPLHERTKKATYKRATDLVSHYLDPASQDSTLWIINKHFKCGISIEKARRILQLQQDQDQDKDTTTMTKAAAAAAIIKKHSTIGDTTKTTATSNNDNDAMERIPGNMEIEEEEEGDDDDDNDLHQDEIEKRSDTTDEAPSLS